MAKCSGRCEIPRPVTPLLAFDFPAKSPAAGIPAHLGAFDTACHAHRLICCHQRHCGVRKESLTRGKKRGGKADSIARRAEETSPWQRKTAPIGAVIALDVCIRTARVGKMRDPF